MPRAPRSLGKAKPGSGPLQGTNRKPPAPSGPERSRKALPDSDARPPAFPYRYMGRIEQEGMPTILYLTREDHVYAVKVGDVIEGAYEVGEITAEYLEVVYLPLAVKQRIALGAAGSPPRWQGSEKK